MAKKELPTLKDVSRIPEELRPVVNWWQDHGTKALTWAIGVLAVCVAAYLWNADNRAADAAAVAALATDAEVDAQPVIDEGPAASPLLRLTQARSLYYAGDFEGALAVYEEARAALESDPDLKGVADLGRANALAELGRLDEALSAVNALEPALTEGETPHYLLPDLLFAKANILCKQGDKAAAKEALKPLTDAPVESPLAKYAGRAESLTHIIDAYDPANPRFSAPAPALPPPPPPPPQAPPPPPPEAPAAK